MNAAHNMRAKVHNVAVLKLLKSFCIFLLFNDGHNITCHDQMKYDHAFVPGLHVSRF